MTIVFKIKNYLENDLHIEKYVNLYNYHNKKKNFFFHTFMRGFYRGINDYTLKIINLVKKYK